MGEDELGALEERRVDREAVVLRGDFHLAGAEVLHRMVGAPVAELELEGLAPASQAQDLVAEADPEKGDAGVHDLPRSRHRVVAGLGVAGAVGEEDAVGLQGQGLVARGGGGDHRDVAAGGGEHAEDVLLHPEVVGHDPVGLRDGRGVEVVRLRARHFTGQVQAHHRSRRAGLGDERIAIARTGRDDPALGAVGAKVPGEGPGVDLADADDTRLFEIAVQLAGRPPRGGTGRCFPHHEAGHLRPGRFDVVPVHAVVADVGIGHGDDLAGVGGVGEDLLVTAQGRVEDDLTGRLARGSEGAAFHDDAVLEGKRRPGAIAVHDS